MSFAESIVSGFTNTFNFQGRASRSEFWWFILFIMIILFVKRFFLLENSIIDIILSYTLIIPTISLGVRRFHDTDRTGWYTLLNFIPVFGLLVVLVFWAQPGTPGPNRYGPAPA